MNKFLPDGVKEALTPEEIEKMYLESVEEVEKILAALAPKRMSEKA